jgi:hypothetical protein
MNLAQTYEWFLLMFLTNKRRPSTMRRLAIWNMCLASLFGTSAEATTPPEASCVVATHRFAYVSVHSFVSLF